MLILRVQHFLKVLLPGSWRSVLSTLFSSDPGFDAYSFKALQLQAIAIHTAGAFFLLLSVCIKDFYFNNFSWDLYFWVIICILGSFITFSGKSALWIFCGGFFVTIASTMGFGLLTRIAVNPFIWFLPLGLIFTIFPISLHQRISHYFFTTLLSWAIFYKVIDPHFDNEIESIFAGLVILGTMLVGFMTVSIFLIIRKKNYEFEIQLHKMANVDVLTNLPNRRAFMTGLDWAIKSESSRGFLFFMMLDIDDFKKINDKFGHDVGDLALKEVAKVIKKHAEEHYFGRLGGEEFAVAAHMDNSQINILAQKIIDDVHALTINGSQLSVSIGISKHDGHETEADLMRRADEALYRAKQAGKNRFKIAKFDASNLDSALFA